MPGRWTLIKIYFIIDEIVSVLVFDKYVWCSWIIIIPVVVGWCHKGFQRGVISIEFKQRKPVCYHQHFPLSQQHFLSDREIQFSL